MKATFNALGKPLRAISLLLLIGLYLFFSIGVMKSTHFCMGREASVAFFTTEAEKCACAEYMAEKHGCCDDQHDLLKIEDDQKVISKLALNVREWMVIQKIYTRQLIAYDNPVPESQEITRTFSPPPLYKLHCSLVFYSDDSDLSA